MSSAAEEEAESEEEEEIFFGANTTTKELMQKMQSMQEECHQRGLSDLALCTPHHTSSVSPCRIIRRPSHHAVSHVVRLVLPQFAHPDRNVATHIDRLITPRL